MPSSSRSSTGSDPTATDPTATVQNASESKDAPFYCPGCGKRVQYQQQCTGKPEAPHPPIEVVSTDELSGDPENFTAAPSSENLG